MYSVVRLCFDLKGWCLCTANHFITSAEYWWWWAAQKPRDCWTSVCLLTLTRYNICCECEYPKHHLLIFVWCLLRCSSIPVVCNGETPDSEIVVAGSSDALDEQEEELRRREIELEAEERKLEETLEYQRRIEDEAKQKHLAEQHKKVASAIPEKVVEGGEPDACVKHCENDQHVDEQFIHCVQVSKKNVYVTNIIELVAREIFCMMQNFLQKKISFNYDDNLQIAVLGTLVAGKWILKQFRCAWTWKHWRRSFRKDW